MTDWLSDPAASGPGGLFGTKIVPPTIPGGFLRRVRLDARLDAGVAGPVPLVVAGAGSGKTPVVASWAWAVATASVNRAQAPCGRVGRRVRPVVIGLRNPIWRTPSPGCEYRSTPVAALFGGVPAADAARWQAAQRATNRASLINHERLMLAPACTAAALR